MAKKVTLGGDRLGAGKKMTEELHNYGMNSFNLEQDWKSTMAPGILYPCLKILGTTHGSLDIDIDSIIRTLPTRGPLFGSYKLQVDLFSVPFRLYQGILHNNAIEIGLNMSQVKLPKMTFVTADGPDAPIAKGSDQYTRHINPTSLEKYLGLSGYGTYQKSTPASPATGGVTRNLQCVPELAYYDIFKNYYANKQEEKAYVITPGIVEKAEIELVSVKVWHNQYQGTDIQVFNMWKTDEQNWVYEITTEGNDEGVYDLDKIVKFTLTCGPGGNNQNITLYDLMQDGYGYIEEKTNNKLKFGLNKNDITLYLEDYGSEEDNVLTIEGFEIDQEEQTVKPEYTSDIVLTPFALKNIDRMRQALLRCNFENAQFTIKDAQENIENNVWWGTDSGEDQTGLPYIACVKTTEDYLPWNAFTQNGLVVKTYQSDLFNNWLQTEYVDMITTMTTMDTTNGFSIDTLNLAEKIYNLLNRILVAGGTYQDWQEAVYGEGVMRMCETPMYIGGMSAEVLFEAVVSTSETNVEGDKQALGSLGGKGTQVGKEGGENIHVKFEEPGYVIGIASLTPRICYNQGNDWDRTEINTLDDLHKPELDGIGFQNLIAEQMAWWTTADKGGNINKQVVGKQTAWINYQTAVDKSYGDFARTGGSAFMVLNRNYEMGQGNQVVDLTTYIDPAKYNYAFAYDRLDAQNFWAQIHFKITARWKMGAQQLPNL